MKFDWRDFNNKNFYLVRIVL